MAIVPAAVELNSVPYRLYDAPDVVPYKEILEPRLIQAPEISGASRPSRSGRPDKLTWRWDDWSGGEGQKFIDLRLGEESFRRYHYNSTGAVDVSVSGQISLGYKLTQSYASGGTTRTQGPFLVNTKYDATNNDDNIGFLTDDKLFTMGAVDTWTDRGTVAAAAGNKVAGPASNHGGYIYAAYTDGSGGAASSRVRQLIWDGTTLTQTSQQTSANMESPIAADNRLYVLYDGGAGGTAGQKLYLRQTALSGTLPLAFTDVYAADGVGFTTGIAALGNRIHFLVQAANGEEPKIHIWDGAKGFERIATEVGFRMNTTPYRGAAFMGDVLYLAGYHDDTVKRGAVWFMTPGKTGTLGILRDNIEDNVAQVLLPTPQNVLLIGQGRNTSATSKVFAFDATNQGISQVFEALPSGFEVTSMLLVAGRVYVACRAAAAGSAGEVRVYRTTPSGDNVYTDSTVVRSSFWDFGYSEEVKLIHDIVVEMEPLPTGCTVSVSYEDEAGTVITTDIEGSTMTYSTLNGTSKTWRISGVNAAGTAVTRRAKRISMRLTMTEGGTNANTPTVKAITCHATVLGWTKFYDLAVSLEDETPTTRILNQQVSGEQQYSNLLDITPTDPSSVSVVKFTPHFPTGNARWFPKGSIETATPVGCEVVSSEIRMSEQGNSYARVLLRETTVTN